MSSEQLKDIVLDTLYYIWGSQTPPYYRGPSDEEMSYRALYNGDLADEIDDWFDRETDDYYSESWHRGESLPLRLRVRWASFEDSDDTTTKWNLYIYAE